MFDAYFKLIDGTMEAASRVGQANLQAAARSVELTASAYARMWGFGSEPPVQPDSRFEADAWRENPLADLTRRAYAITGEWMEAVAGSLEAVNPDLHRRADFWTRQFIDALSPSNFAVTNPQVWEEIVRTGGASLARGYWNLLADLRRGRISQVPEGSFQVGVDLAVTPGKVVYRNPLIELIQYAPTTGQVHAVPLLAIPPWINKYYVMDLRPGNSMYKYLVEAGFTLFTISWKNPDDSVLDLGWDDYVDLGPLAALEAIKAIAGAEKVNTLGYCLGGIIQQTMLAYMAKTGDQSVNSATYFATHQDFSNAGEISVFIDEHQVRFLEWLMEASGGYLDGRNMAATFNMLRANDLFWNYVVNNYLLGKQPPAFDLLYWNNDGTRVPGKVHSFLVREFFLKNKLKEPNGIKVKGVGLDLNEITTPTYVVAATGDHIVPWEGAFLMRQLQGGLVRFILTSGGHIAGIINPPEGSRREFWTNPDETTDAKEWLAGAERHHGSWWLDWIPWLQERSGDKVTPPEMGSAKYPPLMDAPGSYILEQ